MRFQEINVRHLFEIIGKVRRGGSNNKLVSVTTFDPTDTRLAAASTFNVSASGTNNYKDEFTLSQEDDKLFDEVVGYYDIKRLFGMAISTEEPVHIILVGPPASAKTVFMRCLMKLPSCYFTDGSNTTKSGMLDYIFDNKPKYIIIDEINKMQYRDQAFC